MKKAVILFLALLLTCSSGCGNKSEDSSASEKPKTTAPSESESAVQVSEPDDETEEIHISPIETITAQMGTEKSVGEIIPKTSGYNTVKVPLSSLMEDGDTVSSFTFTIYSSDDSDIGVFKGGFGVSLKPGCKAADGKEWYQSPDTSAPTEGSYGEIVWNVPGDIAPYIDAGGDVLFGYWWGDAEKIRLEGVACTFNRTREIPCDGTSDKSVGASARYSDDDNYISVPSADLLPGGAVPEAVTYKISADNEIRKFVGAFGYSSERGKYQSPNTVLFTDSKTAELTWFVPDDAKKLTAKDGELILDYWWSEQPEITLDSVTVKYSLSGDKYGTNLGPAQAAESSGFRSSEDIVKDIRIGWNLGNTLESYNTGNTGLETETGWGNPKATKEMIQSVKKAGFNAVRIPVTWGEHMDDYTIQKEWLNRVQEVVDYAYNSDMYVIINMHHDDYIWFNPTDNEYPADSRKFRKIWEQVAERFADYGDRLIFEGMNEARTIGSANEWIGGTPEERAVVNKYVQDFVDTVRSTGGNNSVRSLIVTTYGANAEEVSMNDLVIPEDDHLIVSLHYYAPWMFSSGQSVIFGDSEKAELSAKFDAMKSIFIDKGYPVIIDEFGCVSAADDKTRARYYESYISESGKRGIKCFVWDNGIFTGEDSYGIFNRKNSTWNETLLDGIMKGAK